jgi:uncharacterized membrane protein
VTDTHPTVSRYLEHLSSRLSGLDTAERREVIDEITNHIADATAAGKPLAQVLESLGPADELARAYQVELLLNRPPPSSSGLETALKLAGLVALGGLPSFVIIVVLGVCGVVFLATGVAVFLAGVMAPFGLPPGVELDMDPRWAVALSPLLVIAGAAALLLLRAYVRAAASIVRRILPRG